MASRAGLPIVSGYTTNALNIRGQKRTCPYVNQCSRRFAFATLLNEHYVNHLSCFLKSVLYYHRIYARMV